MVGWLRALLFLLGGVIAAAGTAYFTGLLDPYLGREPAVVATPPSQVQPAPEKDQNAADSNAASKAGSQDQAASEAAGETVESATKQDRLVSPSFDLLRVEPNGSVVIAGKAAPDAQVEILNGDAIIATTKAGREGDFVAVFDKALAPGDYQLSLRTTSGDEVVTSVETAIVSVPQDSSGQVLAMVEAPGQAAELITVPEAAKQPEPAAQGEGASEPSAAPGEDATAADATPEAQSAQSAQSAGEVDAQSKSGSGDAGEAQSATEEPAAAPATEPEVTAAPPAAEEKAQPQIAPVHSVSVDAVEIEGDTIFVAGQAPAGLTVRVYAGDSLLGDARASDGGRFLVEAKRDLPVGSYVIRADVIGADGAVVARAAVPFEREPGEAIAAVAPQQPAPSQEAPAAQAPAAAGPDTQSGEKAAASTDDATAQKEHAKADDLTAPALQRADGAVIIRRGDSLWRISRRVYGRGVRYSTIYLANQDQIADPNRIWPGQVFAVPGETSEGEQADMEAIGDQAVTPDEAPAPSR
ncbi:LysM peptidoglycan-binding domain-containing protein [Aerobium aerolatum]|uniref:Nucleoid-associated protein YgaU, contains BON and LysM domains n=1 Tax=Aquamicrobium aerolatum DSM 21857 TaxID=1121003 RepID=A0A1I3N5V3_9HYPH|nr:LysM peptidoglycan-binding domain-containing protein [Aquamicrobium aerolatum]SFJ04694.1 Nucleoid-associated protein YgaU, contains BON and LysM domains [Aquamicrobium aerolatum DSM 21857]